MRIIWTAHAEDRQREWQLKKGLTRVDVEAIIQAPDQIALGDLDTKVAQSKWKNGLVRVPFVGVPDGRKILTVYWTSRVKRYWRE